MSENKPITSLSDMKIRLGSLVPKFRDFSTSNDTGYARLNYIESKEEWKQLHDEIMECLGPDAKYDRGFYSVKFKAVEGPSEQRGEGGINPYAGISPSLRERVKVSEEDAKKKGVTSQSSDKVDLIVKETSPVLKPWQRMVEFLPLLSTVEKEALRESLKQYGLKHPILALPDGRIIDGHHRWELLEGKIPAEKVEVLDLDDETAFGLGVSLNLDRRQLSPEIIREVKEKQHTAYLELRNKSLYTQERAAKDVGISRNTAQNWENTSNVGGNNASKIDLRLSIPKSEQPKIVERIKSGENQAQVAADYGLSQQRISQILRQVETRKPQPSMDEYHQLPQKKYRCIVIDPPWPMKNIERETRPNQGKYVDYPTLTLEQIGAIPLKDVIDESGCHIYLWVTHKHLPDGLALFEKWGIKYQCTLTWVKNVGFTPFSWMYSTEHILFGRVGNLDLLKLGERLDFKADVREHSRKPEEFYALVRKVSPEPRLDMFSREKHEAFDQYGNEADKFSEAT